MTAPCQNIRSFRREKYAIAVILLSLFCVIVLISLLIWLIVWLINRARDKKQRVKLAETAPYPSHVISGCYIFLGISVQILDECCNAAVCYHSTTAKWHTIQETLLKISDLILSSSLKICYNLILNNFNCDNDMNRSPGRAWRIFY